jgi:hypothetical protein
MLGNTLHGNWESLRLPGKNISGLHWEVLGRKPMINGRRQSDGDIVPEKFPNDPQGEEGMEGRSPVKGNAQEHPSHRTQSRAEGMPVVLERIRKAVSETTPTSLPETRAGCGNAARPDPWGGQPVKAVPTPTVR